MGGKRRKLTSESAGAARLAGALKGTVAAATTLPRVRELIELDAAGASTASRGAASGAIDWVPLG